MGSMDALDPVKQDRPRSKLKPKELYRLLKPFADAGGKSFVNYSRAHTEVKKATLSIVDIQRSVKLMSAIRSASEVVAGR